MKFKKGNIPWNKGKKSSIETRNKISNSLIGSHRHLGIPVSDETKEKIRKKLLGRKLSKSTREKMLMSKKGKPNGSFGRKLSDETKRKISIAHSGKKHNMPVGWVSPNKGKHASFELRKKLSISHSKEKIFMGFKSSLNKQLRGSIEWKIWREKVFIRDNFTCQRCKAKGVYIEPHHIITVKECINQNIIYKIFDIENGITLCRECHKVIHKWKIKESLGGD